MSTAQPKQIEVVLPELHEGQKRIVTEARRYNILACGRRFGKTTLGIDLALDKALDGYPVAFFSPTYKMLTEIWRETVKLAKPVTSRVAVADHRLELITQGVIDMWSLDSPDSVRGRKYARVVIDEAAMVADLKRAWQEVIRPTLTDYQGDAFFLSTPKGVNYFHEIYGLGVDPEQTEWAAWHMPTLDNPYILAEEVEAARMELPELTFRQEYLAAFVQSEGAVFRNITPNMIAKDTKPDEHKDHQIIAGVDWAQKHDFTCISVVCETCKTELELDRFNQISWDFQRGRLQAIAEKWGVKDILAEENSIGSPNIEALQDIGLPVRAFQTTATSKPPLIQSLALALEKEEIKWRNIPVATAELEAYESKVNANTGRVSYSAPEGMNDDTVIARALVVHAITVKPRRFLYSTV